MKTLIKTAVLLLAAGHVQAQTLQDALKLTNNERYSMATAAYKKLVQAEPNNGDYYFWYGENYINSGYNDSALVVFKQGDALNASNPMSKVGLGRYYAYTGKNTEATKYFQEAKMLMQTQAKSIQASKQAVIYLQIAEAWVNGPTKNLDEANNLLAAAEKLDAKNADVYMLRGDVFATDVMNGSKAIASYKKAKEINPKLCQADYRIGILWINAKNLGLAIEAFDQAIACDPTYAPAYRGKAEALYRQKNYKGGVENYEKYLNLNAGDPDALGRYGTFLYLIGEYEKAIEMISSAQQRDSSVVVLFRVLNWCQFETGKYEAALINSDKFLAKAKAKGRPAIISDDYEYRSKIYSKLKKDSLGVIELNKAYEMDSSRKELLYNMGVMSFTAKKYGDAVNYILRKKNSGAKMAANDYNYLGRSYFFLEKYVEGDSAFAKVVELSPTYIQGYYWRGRCNAKLDPTNKEGKARPYMEKVIELGAADAVKNKRELTEAYGNLGQYHYNNGNFGCTKAYMEALQKIDPENAGAKQILGYDNVKKATTADLTTCVLPPAPGK
jgi:tetratricopeptide (TPR) repeat protein